MWSYRAEVMQAWIFWLLMRSLKTGTAGWHAPALSCTLTSADLGSGLDQNNGPLLVHAARMMREESRGCRYVLHTLTGFRPDWSFCFRLELPKCCMSPCPLLYRHRTMRPARRGETKNASKWVTEMRPKQHQRIALNTTQTFNEAPQTQPRNHWIELL